MGASGGGAGGTVSVYLRTRDLRPAPATRTSDQLRLRHLVYYSDDNLAAVVVQVPP